MGATQYYFSGKAEWAKVYPENKDSYKGKTFYSLDLIVPDSEADRFRATGSQHKPKKESEGFSRLKLRRNEDNPVNDEWGGPPQVIIEDKDNPGNYIPFKELIGNGSEVTVKLTVYDSGDGKGTRMDVVRVDEWVEYGGTKVDTSGPDIGVPF